MKLIASAERTARGLAVTAALLASVSLTEAPGTAHAQWGGGFGGVDWQWAPAVNAGVPIPAVPYAYGYTYNGVPDHFQPAYAYHPIYGFPGSAYSGYGDAYASGYAQGYGDGYGYAQGYGDGYGHGYDNGAAGGYGNNVGVYGYGYPGNGYPYPY